jgi:nucleotide-binding universal stress UspA family protein
MDRCLHDRPAVVDVRRILFPIDFSEPTYATAPFVDAMARKFHADVTLLSVVPVPPRPVSDEPGEAVMIDPEYLKDDLEPRLDSAFRKEFAHLKVERVVELGEPAEVIASFADTQGIDLVMMPTYGYGPLRHLLLGSVTTKVVHDTQCPVWTGVHKDQFLACEDPACRAVLCAVDRTPESTPAMEWAAHFAEHAGATLRLVHVIPGMDGRHGRRTPSGLRFCEELQAEALQAIKSLQKREHVNAPTSVLAGDIATEICREAENYAADLLVIGRGMVHETPGRLGKHAYEIMRLAPCPVISI